MRKWRSCSAVRWRRRTYLGWETSTRTILTGKPTCAGGWLGQPCRTQNHGTYFLWDPGAAPNLQARKERRGLPSRTLDHGTYFLWDPERHRTSYHLPRNATAYSTARAWLYGRMWEIPSQRTHWIRRCGVAVRVLSSTCHQPHLPQHRASFSQMLRTGF